MEKLVVFLLAAVGGFFAVTSFGAGADGDGASGGIGVHMPGCMRQMEQVIPTKEQATRACECTYSEFEKKGYSLTDAFGSDFEDMSRITRKCAVQNGARLPN